jgi:SnoaL-like domain
MISSSMLDLIWFVRYAYRFERAFRTDRWDAVRSCFRDDASYEIAGSGTSYDGIVRGADAIVTLFRRMLDEVDRRYDRRQPRLVGIPRVLGGEVCIAWSVKYSLDTVTAIVTGTSRCAFEHGRIRHLHDAMHADECARWVALVARP